MKSASVLLLAFTILAQAAKFTDKCHEPSVKGPSQHASVNGPRLHTYLNANCGDGDDTKPTFIDMDNCLGSQNGRPVWQADGRISESGCRCNVPAPSGESSPGYLGYCNCTDDQGKTVSTNVDFTEQLSVVKVGDDWLLSCFDQVGQAGEYKVYPDNTAIGSVCLAAFFIVWIFADYWGAKPMLTVIGEIPVVGDADKKKKQD